jgi:leader peptidase (prepilin peptidase)/N-methyltransferase
MASSAPVEVGLVVCFGSVFVLLASLDLRARTIPNAVVYPALLCSWAWVDRGPISALVGGGGAFAVAVVFRTLSRGALGGGDVKMAALVGGVVGYPAVLIAGAVAAVGGGLTALLLLVTRRATRTTALPYVPFLGLGGIIALLR